MAFWVFALIILAALTVWVSRSFLSEQVQTSTNSADLEFYKSQLEEVERDLERGVLDQETAARTRAEISRKIISLGNAPDRPGQSSPQNARLGVLLIAVSLLAGIGIYTWIGAPGYPDFPLDERIEAAERARAERPSQTEAEAAFPPTGNPDADPDLVKLVEDLRAAVASRTGDIEGLRLLARNEAFLGNLASARLAHQRLILEKGEEATAQDWTELAELMVFAAGGVVTPETDRVLAVILEMEPDNETARYYVGLMHAQTGRADIAFSYWRGLLEESAPDAPWLPVIRSSISQLAELAGVPYTPPSVPVTKGPTQADIAAAQNMSAEERNAMIEGMVEGLAARLAAEGGPPEDWARLISALGVLGQTDRAASIWQEAQVVFAGNESGIAIISHGAEAAGVLK